MIIHHLTFVEVLVQHLQEGLFGVELTLVVLRINFDIVF